MIVDIPVDDPSPLVAVSTIFLLALTGAVVLFGFLKATAVFKTIQGQASGALAGFLMIFAALGGTYLKLAASPDDSKLWTIKGRVEVAGSEGPRDADILVMPPPLRVLTSAGGTFRLDRVEVISGVWPELHLEGEGFLSATVVLKAEDLTLYPGLRLAELKKPLALASDGGQVAEL